MQTQDANQGATRSHKATPPRPTRAQPRASGRCSSAKLQMPCAAASTHARAATKPPPALPAGKRSSAAAQTGQAAADLRPLRSCKDSLPPPVRSTAPMASVLQRQGAHHTGQPSKPVAAHAGTERPRRSAAMQNPHCRKPPPGPKAPRLPKAEAAHNAAPVHGPVARSSSVTAAKKKSALQAPQPEMRGGTSSAAQQRSSASGDVAASRAIANVGCDFTICLSTSFAFC